MNMSEDYFPALGWLNSRWYGFICTVSGLGSGFKKAIFEAVHLHGEEVVADIGCGDGTFLSVLSRHYPHIVAHGFDPDATLLAQAHMSTHRAKHRVVLQQAVAQEIPRHPNTFDIVFCTLTLHHLSDTCKKEALGEMFRILKPGGKVVIVDFSEKETVFKIPHFYLFETSAYLQACLDNKVPFFVEEAGFVVQSNSVFRGNNISMTVGVKPHTPYYA